MSNIRKAKIEKLIEYANAIKPKLKPQIQQERQAEINELKDCDAELSNIAERITDLLETHVSNKDGF